MSNRDKEQERKKDRYSNTENQTDSVSERLASLLFYEIIFGSGALPGKMLDLGLLFFFPFSSPCGGL